MEDDTLLFAAGCLGVAEVAEAALEVFAESVFVDGEGVGVGAVLSDGAVCGSRAVFPDGPEVQKKEKEEECEEDEQQQEEDGEGGATEGGGEGDGEGQGEGQGREEEEEEEEEG